MGQFGSQGLYDHQEEVFLFSRRGMLASHQRPGCRYQIWLLSYCAPVAVRKWSKWEEYIVVCPLLDNGIAAC